MTVKELLEELKKAAITTSSGGQLTTEDADKFINTVVSQNELFQTDVEVISMTAATRNIDVIGLASRVMRKATEGVAPTEIVGVNIGRRVLSVEEVILPYDVSLRWLEENIEGKNADTLLQNMFATQFGNDLLDLGCNGDEASADPFLSINDGWLTIMKADSGVNEFTGQAASKTDYKGHVFPGLLSTMPNKWKRNPDALALYVSPAVEEGYRDQLAERATGLGDVYLTEKKEARFKGILVKPVPYFPDDMMVLTIRRNFKIGIGRQISYERQNQPRKRIMEYTITAKADFEYAISEAVTYAYTGDWI
jgi:hypothetical protein